MAKAKKPAVCLFSFASGSPTWGYGKGDTEDRGLYDPRFSRVESVWQGTYPDPGIAEGKVPSIIFGERLGPEMIERVPKLVTVGGHTPRTLDKHPRDINIITDGEFGSNKIVSQRLKDVIENVEPGVHQFFPFTFVNCVTREPIWTDVSWYFLNITTWIAPDVFFEWEAMGDVVEFGTYPPLGFAKERLNMSFMPPIPAKKYVVRQSVVASDLHSKHLWVTTRYFRENLDTVYIMPKAFCSNEFRLACKAAGLKGGHFIPLNIL